VKKSRRANRKSLGKRFKPRFESLEQRVLLTSHGFVENGVEDAAAHYADDGLDPANDWERIRYSASGRAYYLDPADREEGSGCTCGGAGCPACDPETTPSTIVPTSDRENVGLNEIPVYHSNPGAANVFYIDFNGQVVDDTDWNENDRNGNGNDGKPIHAIPYDTDGDLTTFSETELDAIYEIWQRVSEDFLPFNIDITTEEPDPESFKNGREVMRVIVSTNIDDPSVGGAGKKWFPDVGGVSFVASYWRPGDTPAWVFQNKIPKTPKAIAEAASHEFGHTLGLGHRGKDGAEYHNGTGEGETSWAPIMGAGYTSNVTQWTDGNYVGGRSNGFGDFEIMTNDVFGVTFRDDDHGQANENATPLTNTKGHIIGDGIIETNTDYDVFSFEHLGGPVEILVSPAAVGPNLDIVIELYDSESSIAIATFAPEETLSAELKTELAAGTYYLLVDGGGYAPEVGEGFSEYASIGSYHIDGILGVPVLTAIAGDNYSINEGESLALDGALSYGPVAPLQFAWDIDGDGGFDDATGATPMLSWDQLQSLEVPIIDQGNFEIRLRVSDSTGSVAEETATLTVHNVAPEVALTDPDEPHTSSRRVRGRGV
jgi:serralysin